VRQKGEIGLLLLLFRGTYTRDEVQVKAGSRPSLSYVGFATSKITPDDSLAEGTLYILNIVPKTTSNLRKAPMLPAD
jgi:hypothetical protein